MTTYNCRKCGKTISPTEKQIKKSDFICKVCVKEYRRKRRESGNPIANSKCKMTREWHRNYYKKYKNRPEVRERARLRQIERRKCPIEAFKNKARRITRTAILNGTITKKPCKVCGDTNAHAHHNDYNEPLDITWLCPVHHKELHLKAKGEWDENP